jgi:hypothetical protein
MYRFRFRAQVKYGHFKEFLTLWEQLNEVGRSRGWAEATFWVPTVGTANEFISEIEYPDLETFKRESDAFSADPEAMTLFRSSSEHVVEGSGHTELLERAPHLA